MKNNATCDVQGQTVGSRAALRKAPCDARGLTAEEWCDAQGLFGSGAVPSGRTVRCTGTEWLEGRAENVVRCAGTSWLTGQAGELRAKCRDLKSENIKNL